MDMDIRKIKILQAIINDYIDTAEPVGSRTIAKKYDLGISSATIRNEMADLEEMGYLEQLHTSSGRKPSNKGYRLYVDKLIKIPQLTPSQELIIKNKLLNDALYEVDKLVKQATMLISELTKLTCIVKAPSMSKSCIKSIQLFSVDSNNVVSVIVTDSGMIKDTVIRLKNSISREAVAKMSNLLNIRLTGLTIEQINLEVINKLKQDLCENEEIFNAIIPALYDSLNSEFDSEVYMEGGTNIFNYPEYNDIERAKEFLSLLEDTKNIRKLLNNTGNVTVTIGEENFVEEAKDCSVISAIYSFRGKPIGAIGVIGPTRIPYSKVISVVQNVIKELNESIDENFFDDR